MIFLYDMYQHRIFLFALYIYLFFHITCISISMLQAFYFARR